MWVRVCASARAQVPVGSAEGAAQGERLKGGEQVDVRKSAVECLA